MEATLQLAHNKSRTIDTPLGNISLTVELMLFRTNDAAPLKQTVYPRRQSKSSSTISEASVLFGVGLKMEKRWVIIILLKKIEVEKWSVD